LSILDSKDHTLNDGYEYKIFRECLQFNIVSSWFKVIYDMGDRIDDVYFPFNALVSLVKGMADGKVVEVGLVGSNGMTGVAGLLGGGVSSERAIVQIPNGGVRTKIAVIRESSDEAAPLQNILLAYLIR